MAEADMKEKEMNKGRMDRESRWMAFNRVIALSICLTSGTRLVLSVLRVMESLIMKRQIVVESQQSSHQWQA